MVLYKLVITTIQAYMKACFVKDLLKENLNM